MQQKQRSIHSTRLIAVLLRSRAGGLAFGGDDVDGLAVAVTGLTQVVLLSKWFT